MDVHPISFHRGPDRKGGQLRGQAICDPRRGPGLLRAYRCSDLTARIRVFEVDHPASQSWKEHQLRYLGIEIPENLVFAPVDFERQTLREGLVAAGFG
jgi:Leucine carboxyl methyltransferase